MSAMTEAARIDRLLDDALAASFPASDPVAFGFGHELLPEADGLAAPRPDTPFSPVGRRSQG